MTYNFDPDRWYDMHRAALDRRHAAGEIDDETYRAACLDLDRRFEEMVSRLDGTYELP
jgi:hypothetical protein